MWLIVSSSGRQEKVKERCRQLMGMSDCVMHLSGARPQVFRLAYEKYALKQEGDYGIVSSTLASLQDVTV